MTITGARCREFAGRSVAAAGDVNGDGLDDVVIGAPGGSPDDEGLATQSGRAYVVFGRRDGGSVDLGRLGRLGIVIEGRRHAVTDAFGWSVDGAGDVDRDGLDDIVIAAPGNPGFEERSQRGAAYVVYGRRRGGIVRVRRLGRRGFRIAATGPGGLRSVAGRGRRRRRRSRRRDPGRRLGRARPRGGDRGPRRAPHAARAARPPRPRRLPAHRPRPGRGDRVRGRRRRRRQRRRAVRRDRRRATGQPHAVQHRRRRRLRGLRPPRAADVDLRALGPRGIEIRGSGSDWAGFAVASAGRIGGDRLDDVALLDARLARRRLRPPVGGDGPARPPRARGRLSDRRHGRAEPVVLRQRVRRPHHRRGRGRRRRRRRHATTCSPACAWPTTTTGRTRARPTCSSAAGA